MFIRTQIPVIQHGSRIRASSRAFSRVRPRLTIDISTFHQSGAGSLAPEPSAPAHRMVFGLSAILFGLAMTTPTTGASGARATASRVRPRADISADDRTLGETMARGFSPGGALSFLLPVALAAGAPSCPTAALALGSRGFLDLHGLSVGPQGLVPADPSVVPQLAQLASMGAALPLAAQQQQTMLLINSNQTLSRQLQQAQQARFLATRSLDEEHRLAQWQQLRMGELQAEWSRTTQQLNATMSQLEEARQRLLHHEQMTVRISELEAQLRQKRESRRQAEEVQVAVNSSLSKACAAATAALSSRVSKQQRARGMGTSSLSFMRQIQKKQLASTERKALKKQVAREHVPSTRHLAAHSWSRTADPAHLTLTAPAASQIKSLRKQLDAANETIAELSSETSMQFQRLIQRAADEPEGVPAAMLALIQNQLTCLKNEKSRGKKCHWDPRVLRWCSGLPGSSVRDRSALRLPCPRVAPIARLNMTWDLGWFPASAHCRMSCVGRRLASLAESGGRHVLGVGWRPACRGVCPSPQVWRHVASVTPGVRGAADGRAADRYAVRAASQAAVGTGGWHDRARHEALRGFPRSAGRSSVGEARGAARDQGKCSEGTTSIACSLCGRCP